MQELQNVLRRLTTRSASETTTPGDGSNTASESPATTSDSAYPCPNGAHRHSPPPACTRCCDQGFVLRKEPNPAAAVPFLRAEPCPSCGGPHDQADDDATLWRLSGITTEERVRCTFEAFQVSRNPDMREARDRAQDWAHGAGLPFLLLFGETRGTGKTHLAISAAQGCILRHEAVLFCPAPRLLDELRATQRRPNEGEPEPPSLFTVRRRAESYPNLVLDDLGAGRDTDWAQEQLFTIVNERHRNRLRTVITANVSPERLESRIRSRLCDWQCSTVIACRGVDYRSGRA